MERLFVFAAGGAAIVLLNWCSDTAPTLTEIATNLTGRGASTDDYDGATKLMGIADAPHMGAPAWVTIYEIAFENLTLATGGGVSTDTKPVPARTRSAEFPRVTRCNNVR